MAEPTYTWAEVMARTGYDEQEVFGLTAGWIGEPGYLTEDGRVTQETLDLLMRQAETDGRAVEEAVDAGAPEAAPRRWWHAFGAEVEGVGWVMLLTGPGSLGPEDRNRSGTRVADAKLVYGVGKAAVELPHLSSWDRQPLESELAAIEPEAYRDEHVCQVTDG